MQQNGTNWIPSAEQIQMAELLLNPEDRRTKTEKMDSLGVSRRKFYTWMKDKNYIDYLNNEIKYCVKGEIADVWKALLLKTKRGDTGAIKLFFEMIGEYSQKVELGGKIDVHNYDESRMAELLSKATPEEIEKLVEADRIMAELEKR